MKKVIFVCLLSLSMCLSKPADGTAGTTADQHGEQSKVQPPAPQGPTKTPEAQSNVAPAHQDASPTKPPTAAPNETASTTIAPVTKDGENKSTKAPSKDDGKSPTSGDKKDTSPSPAPNTEKTPAVPSQPTTENTTTTTTSTTTTTTTVKPEDKPTEAPKEGDKIVQARGFDGASFIGGIILTLGLLAIGFMGFKYYKNQTERNYHTL